MVGGNAFEYKPVTVTTYASSYIHLEKWANRYGLLIFDAAIATIYGGPVSGGVVLLLMAPAFWLARLFAVT